jgi:hypothetical protein
MTRVGRVIRKLHDQVVDKRSRVEITRAGCEDCCVMISKSELETLERGLAILADTEEFSTMCQSLKDILSAAGMVYAPQAAGQSEAVQHFQPGSV